MNGIIEPSCELCRYWEKTNFKGTIFGDCHRYAPRPKIMTNLDRDSDEDFFAVWPVTFDDSFCGEFSIKSGANNAKVD